MPKYAIGAGQPPSSDPASIYRSLHHAVKTGDTGDQKIISQKKTLRALAVKWAKEGSISANQRDDIFAMLKHSQVADFRPLIYVIPFPPVAARVLSVPRLRRASLHPEFIIPDLDVNEFQIVEPVPCP